MRTELDFTFGFKAPDENYNVYLRVESYLIFKRQQNANGTISSSNVNGLYTTTQNIEIDVSIPTELILCDQDTSASTWTAS